VLLCGCFPFNQQNVRTVSRSHYRLEWPKWAKGLSREARGFVKGLLEYSPGKRMTAAAALAHPWIASAARVAPNSLSLESPGRLRTLAEKRAANRSASRARSAQRHQNARRHIVMEESEEEVSPRRPVRGRGPEPVLGKSAPAM